MIWRSLQLRALMPGTSSVPSRTSEFHSFIADRHSDLRNTSGFEPPPSKRLGGHFIENCATGALHHHHIRNLAACSVDNHDANTASSNIGVLCLVWILGQGSTHCHGLGS